MGAYCLLLFNSWQSDRPGYLPDDENRLRRIARLSTAQWADSRELLLSKFPPAPDAPALRHNPRLVHEAARQALKRERLAANGRKGGRPAGLPAPPENQLLSAANQLISENTAIQPAAPPENQLLTPASQKLSAGKQLPPKSKANEKAFNFSFTTSNEVEREATFVAPPSPPVESKKKKQGRGKASRLTAQPPANDRPPPPADPTAELPPTRPPRRQPAASPELSDVQAYAAAQYPASEEAQAEAAAFFDHFQSNGWRVSGKTPMADWQAAFRGWMRRCPQFQPAANARAGSAPPSPTRTRTAPKPPDPTRWS